MRNLITDVAGVSVGCADDLAAASGTTIVLFDRPAVAGLCAPGGARLCATACCSPLK